MSPFIFRKEPAPETFEDWKVYGVYMRLRNQRIGYLVDLPKAPSGKRWMAYWGPKSFAASNDGDADAWKLIGEGYDREHAATLIYRYHMRGVMRAVREALAETT